MYKKCLQKVLCTILLFSSSLQYVKAEESYDDHGTVIGESQQTEMIEDSAEITVETDSEENEPILNEEISEENTDPVAEESEQEQESPIGPSASPETESDTVPAETEDPEISYMTSDSMFEYTEEDGKISITGYTGTETEIEIPASIDGKPVSAIGYKAFYRSSLISVTIPEGVISIEGSAFSTSPSLSKVVIPSTVTKMGIYVFENCINLSTAGPIGEDYNIQLGWKSEIPEYAFYNANYLQEIKIPLNITKIGNKAFYDCTSLRSVDIPINVSVIEESAFSNCSRLQSIQLPFAISEISRKCFENCSRLGELVIPGNVKEVGMSAFEGCSGITELNMLSGIEEISIYAFKNCTGLREVNIPDGVTKIWGFAFDNCTGIEHISIPGSVKEMDYAFNGCKNIKTAGNMENYDLVFHWDKTIPYAALSGFDSLEEIAIPHGIVTIEAFALGNCKNLKSISLPSTLQSIEPRAFTGCSSLEKFNLNINSSYFSVINDVLFSGDERTLIAYPAGKSEGKYNIPKSVSTISYDAFDHAQITEIIFNERITEIEGGAFSNCKNLKTVRVPDSVTKFGLEVFSNCTSLESVTLPASLTEIPEYTFQGCTSLKSFNVPDNVKLISTSAFDGCTNLKEISLPVVFTLVYRAFSDTGITDIYYSGSEKQWKDNYYKFRMSEGFYDMDLSAITIHYGASNTDTVKIHINYNRNRPNNYEYLEQSTKQNYIITANEQMFSDSAYVIAYWNTEPDGSGKDYMFDSIISNTGKDLLSLNLYAQWVDKPRVEYTQTWELADSMSVSAGVGAGATVGSVELKLGSLTAEGALGGKMSISMSTKGEDKTLEISDEYNRKISKKISIGPKVKEELSKFEPLNVSAGGKASAGSSVSTTLSIEDYNPSNTAQKLELGKYLVSLLARKSGMATIARISEEIGSAESAQQLKTELSYDKKLALGSAELGKIKGTLASVGKKGNLSYSQKYESGNTVTMKSETNTYDLDVSFLTGQMNIKAGQSGSLLNLDGLQKLKIGSFTAGGGSAQIYESMSVKMENGKAVSVKFSNSETYNDSILVMENEKKYKTEIEYKDENAQRYLNSVPAAKEFANERWKLILLDGYPAMQKSPDKLNSVTGDYKLSTEESQIVDIKLPFELGAGLDVGVELGLSGIYSLDYQTSKGVLGSKRNVVFDNTNYENAAKNATDRMDILTILQEALTSINLNSVLKQIAGELGKEVKSQLYNATVKANRAIHTISTGISSIIDGKKVSSFEITTYDTSSLTNAPDIDYAQLEEGKAYTIGEPLYLYLTDENDNILTSFEDSPVELTLFYTDEMLAEAGIDSANAGNLYIYKYDDQLCGYICIGGIRDAEDHSVKTNITEAGEYVIAADYTAPTVSGFTVSDYSQKPSVSLRFAETSFFREISVQLDGNEIVNSDNWRNYFNSGLNAIQFQPQNNLMEGDHVVSVYAVDSAGNQMDHELSYNFTVDTSAPVIDRYTSVYDDNYLRIRAWCFDTDLSSMSSDIIQVLPDGTEKTFSVELDHTDDYYSVLVPLDVQSSSLSVNIVAEDLHSNTTETGLITLTEKDRILDAVNDLWFSMPEGSVFSYTGKAVKPKLAVYEGTELLKEKKDYSLVYSNNTNAGEASITIRGADNYTGNETVSFTISPKKLTDDDISVSFNEQIMENGKEQKVKPVLKWGKTVLKQNKDYTLEYTDVYRDRTAYKDPGAYTVNVSGMGNYEGELTLHYEIISLERTPISKTILAKLSNIIYDGSAHEPDVELTDKNTKERLIRGTDYEITYSDNTVDIGKVVLTITGLGSYTGTRTCSFSITGNALSKAKISNFLSSIDYSGGMPVTQDAQLLYTVKAGGESITSVLNGIEVGKYNLLSDDEKRNFDYVTEYIDNVYPGKATVVFRGINAFTGTITKTYTIMGLPISKADIRDFVSSVVYDNKEMVQNVYLMNQDGSEELEEYRDYTVSYTNNRKAGTATMIITGKGQYTGTVKKKFKIKPYNLATDEESRISVYYASYVPYSKTGAKPEITVYDGDTLLVKGKDYSVSYSNSGKINDGKVLKSAPSIVIKGKGNYTGTDKSQHYTITQRLLTDTIDVSVTDKVFNEKKNGWKSLLTLKDNGKKLAQGKDYTVKYCYLNETEVLNNADKQTVTRIAGEEISENDVLPAGTEIQVMIEGINSYTGNETAVYKIMQADISKAQATVAAKPFTGQKVLLIKDDIVLKIGNTIIDSDNYVIDESTYKNNLNKGKASVVIRGVNDYGSEKTITFTIGAKSLQWWWRNLWQ